jgi:hypothetical protein
VQSANSVNSPLNSLSAEITPQLIPSASSSVLVPTSMLVRTSVLVPMPLALPRRALSVSPTERRAS